MKYISHLLALASVASLSNAGEWWGQINEKSCGSDCYNYIKKCYDCLDTRTCPPTFPPNNGKKKCSKACHIGLPWFCANEVNCFDCKCPNLLEKEPCPFEGATIKKKNCCQVKESLGCSKFRCFGEGKAWECVNKCDDDCLCPNVKNEETCPGEGVVVQNKYCCKNLYTDGCAAWKCPGEGEPWKCIERCF